MSKQPSDTDQAGSKIVCPVCHSSNPVNSKFCAYCGGKLVAETTPHEKNLPFTKFCLKCGHGYPESVKYCFNDGTPLSSTQKTENPSLSQVFAPEKQKQPLANFLEKKVAPNIQTGPSSGFNGFEISETAFIAPIPPEVLKTATHIMFSNPKIPHEVRTVHTHPLFSILAPKPSYSMTGKISNIGFSRKNITSYLLTLTYVEIIFFLWMTKEFFQEEFVEQLQNLLVTVGGIGLIWGSLVTIILILPIIFAGAKISQFQASLEYKIDPMVLILNLALNIFVIQLNFPFPIIVFPGEIKTKLLPSKQELAEALYKSLRICLIITFLATIMMMTLSTFPNSVQIHNLEQRAMKTGYLMVTLALSMNMLPFGTMFGKVVKDLKPAAYWPMLLLAFTFLIYAINLIQ
jgi:hypothetical protein